MIFEGAFSCFPNNISQNFKICGILGTYACFATKTPSSAWEIFIQTSSSSVLCMCSIWAYASTQTVPHWDLDRICWFSLASWGSIQQKLVFKFHSFRFPCANPWHQTLNCSRMTLVECGFFGLDADEPFQRHLDEAYKHFKAFVASRRIQCSQGPFKEKMVHWMVFIILFYLWLGPFSNK